MMSHRATSDVSVLSPPWGLLAGLIWVAASLLPAAAQKLPFTTSTIDDGMADSVVFCMEQDSRGFLWIGTRTGLNRFDGSEFVTFTERDGLAHNVVRDIFVTSDDSLLFGTENGLSRLQDGRFENLGEAEGLPHRSVRSIAEGPPGVLWIGTWGGGLVRLENGQIEIIGTEQGLPHGKVRKLLMGRDGSLWIGTSGGGLARYRDGEITVFQDGLEKLEIRAIWEEPDGRIWVGTRSGSFRLVEGSFVEARPGSELSNQTINVITEDAAGRIWLGTREGGAFALDGERLVRYRTENGLSDNSITTILEDREGNLWFGTYGAGISRLSSEQVLNWEASEGLPNANVYAIVEDRSGCLWFGSNGGGASRLCDGRFELFTTANGLSHDKVVSVTEDRSGALWFGTLEGATRFDGARWSTFDRSDGLAHDIVYDVTEDRDGNLWFGTLGGLSRYRDGQFENFSREDGLAGERVSRILEGYDGTLWLGTDDGLSAYRDGVFTSWTEDEGLVADFINDLYEDEEHRLWIGSRQGLSMMEEGSFSHWTVDDGLSNDNCTAILPGDHGILWIGTNRGLSLFDGETFAVVTAREGLVFDLVNRGAGYRDREGNLWFGTGAGVSRFAAEFRPASLDPPAVEIVDVRVFDRSVPLSTSLQLAHDQNWLTFDFVGLTFRRAPDVRYRYRLAGSGVDWRETRHREVQFSSLAPGDYVFEVSARIGSGEWNREPARFGFTLVPPIWKRPWFVLLALLAVGAFIFFRIWEARNRAQVLEAAVRESTAEVREANDELRWLAHHDRLTGLHNRHYVYEVMHSELSRLHRRRRTVLDEGGSSQPCLAFILIDLDRFKDINDTWDHSAGDKVLERVAEALRLATRDSDLVARWGGEEFLVILRDLERGGLEETPVRILEAVRNLRVGLDNGESIRLTCSLGFTHFPNCKQCEELSWETVAKVADTALMEAKRTGRDRGVGFLWTVNVDSESELDAIVADVQDSVEDGILRRSNLSGP